MSSLIGAVKNLERSLNERHNECEHQWENIPVPKSMKRQLYPIWKFKENKYRRDSVVPLKDVSLMAHIEEKSDEESETKDILKELQSSSKKGNVRKSSLIHHLINPCSFDKVFPTHKNESGSKYEINSCMKNLSKKSETTISEITKEDNHFTSVSRMGVQNVAVKKKISNEKEIRGERDVSLDCHKRTKLLQTISHILIHSDLKRRRRLKEKPHCKKFHQQKSQTRDVSPPQRMVQKYSCLKKNNQSYELKTKTLSRNRLLNCFRKLKGRHPSNVRHHHFLLVHPQYKNRRLITNYDSKIKNSFVKRKKITQHTLGSSSSTIDEPCENSSSLKSPRKGTSKRDRNETNDNPKWVSFENPLLNDFKRSSNEHTSDSLNESEIDVSVLKLERVRVKRSSESLIAGVEQLSNHEQDYISEKSVVEDIPDSSLDKISSCSDVGSDLTHRVSKRFSNKNTCLNSNSSIEEDSPNNEVFVNSNKGSFEQKEINVSSKLKQTKETGISQIVLNQNKDDKNERSESEEYKSRRLNKITVQGRNCSFILHSANDKSPKSSHTSSSKNIDPDNQKLDKTEVHIKFCHKQRNTQRSSCSSNVTSHDLIQDVNSAHFSPQRHKSKTSTSRVTLNSAPDSETGSRQKGGSVKNCNKKMFAKHSKDIRKGKNTQKKIAYKLKRKGVRILSNKVTQCPSPSISTGTQTQESSIYRDKCPLGSANYVRIPLVPDHHQNLNAHRMHQFQKPFLLINNRDSLPSYFQEFFSRSSKPISCSSYYVPCNKGKESPQTYTSQTFSINLRGTNSQTERKLIKQEISTNRQKPLHHNSSMEMTIVPHRSRSPKTTRRPSLSRQISHKMPMMKPEVYISVAPLSKSMGNVCKHSHRHSSSSSDGSHYSRRTSHRSPVRRSTRKECPVNYNHKYFEKLSWKGRTKIPRGRDDEYFENTARSSIKLSHSQTFHNSKSSYVPYPNHKAKRHHTRPEENYYKRSRECPLARFQESYKRSGVAMPSYYNTYRRDFMS